MKAYIEFGGGLGDIFHQIHTGPGYRYLETLGPERQAHVGLVTHNQRALELFQWHPKREFMEVSHYGYWLPEQDREMRAHHAIPPISPISPISAISPIRYYPRPDEVVNGLSYTVAVAASAGMPDRTLPQDVLDDVVGAVLTAGWSVMLVGRSFTRHGRAEIRPSEPELHNCIDMIDRLSVPATAQVVSRCVGLVTCHSALNILGWHLRKPQLVLYPESVFERHFRRPDQWSFGARFRETYHARFDAGSIPWQGALGLFLQHLDDPESPASCS